MQCVVFHNSATQDLNLTNYNEVINKYLCLVVCAGTHDWFWFVTFTQARHLPGGANSMDRHGSVCWAAGSGIHSVINTLYLCTYIQKSRLVASCHQATGKWKVPCGSL